VVCPLKRQASSVKPEQPVTLSVVAMAVSSNVKYAYPRGSQTDRASVVFPHWRGPWMSTTGGGWKRKPTHDELTTMKLRPADLGPCLDLRNAELTVYHMWDESAVGLAAMDEATQTLRFSNEAGHPPGAFGVRKYVVWNVRQGMTDVVNGPGGTARSARLRIDGSRIARRNNQERGQNDRCELSERTRCAAPG
jgi:hypothetical protein